MHAADTEWSARGTEFLTPPKQHRHEIRSHIRDPDGYLIEVEQATDPGRDGFRELHAWRLAHRNRLRCADARAYRRSSVHRELGRGLRGLDVLTIERAATSERDGVKARLSLWTVALVALGMQACHPSEAAGGESAAGPDVGECTSASDCVLVRTACGGSIAASAERAAAVAAQQADLAGIASCARLDLAPYHAE